MRLAKPFIRLPYRFDAARLAAEACALDEAAWMRHPSGLPGNSAIALISSGGGDNDSFEGAKAPTPHLDRCPYVRQVMSSFGEVLSRSRLMKLEGNSEVSLHVDFNYHWYSRVRIHIPVVTNRAVTFQCGQERIHMAAGECWIFDSWRRHRVVNTSSTTRIHLVIDTSGSSRFWDLVATVGDADAAETGANAAFVPFAPGKPAPLRVERFANAAIMAPGECTALVEDLIADFSANATNDAALVAAYTRLLRSFTYDWREIWLVHGDEPDGIPAYRSLIARTRQGLHPNRRALTTSSNGIGVNAVFAQRVLNAALAGGSSSRAQRS